MKVRILGCGPSQGIPSVLGAWGDCQRDNPKNRRARSSILLQAGATNILIDTSPDLREQLASLELSSITGVLFTHTHADHTNGIDELRAFFLTNHQFIPAYGTQETLEDLISRFPYIFSGCQKGPALYQPFLIPHLITEKPFSCGGLKIIPFKQNHGFSNTTGYRIGNFAYSTDVVAFSEDAFETLEGVETWIVDCISFNPGPTHSHLAQTLEWIDRVNPKLAILTHMGNTLDYEDLKSLLPTGVIPAFDGLELEVEETSSPLKVFK